MAERAKLTLTGIGNLRLTCSRLHHRGKVDWAENRFGDLTDASEQRVQKRHRFHRPESQIPNSRARRAISPEAVRRISPTAPESAAGARKLQAETRFGLAPPPRPTAIAPSWRLVQPTAVKSDRVELRKGESSALGIGVYPGNLTCCSTPPMQVSNWQ